MSSKCAYLYYTETKYKLSNTLLNIMKYHIKNIVIITTENILNYLSTLPDYFYTLSYDEQSLYVKVNVICEYGGVWLNIDTLVLNNLETLFSLFDKKDGFFIKDENNNIYTSVFGSNPNTEFMINWKNGLFSHDLLFNYEIFEGVDTMYPVNEVESVNEFLKKPYISYKTIIRNYQPLIILNNLVIKEYEHFSINSPLTYFLNNNNIQLYGGFTDYEDYEKNKKKLNIELLVTNIIPKSNVNIAIILPHQNNLNLLHTFIDSLKLLTKKPYFNYDIYIIDQNNYDGYNKGLLFNIGYYIANKTKIYDRYIFHDITIIPSQKIFSMYFTNLNVNIKYYDKVIGFKSYDFNKINGFINTSFDYDIEYECLYNRLAYKNIKMYYISENCLKCNKHIDKKKKYIILEDLNKPYLNGIAQLEKYYINYRNEIYSKDIKYSTNLDNSTLLLYFKPKVSNISLFHIDYLAIHGKTDYFLLNNYVDKKIEERKNSMSGIVYQHSINKKIISYIEPLVMYNEIETKIFNTYTHPKKFEHFIDIDPIINSLVYDEFENYSLVSYIDLKNTIKFIYETYGEVIYIRIRDNEIKCAYNIYNEILNIDWYKNIIYNKEILEKSNKQYFTAKNPHYGRANNCLVDFESKNYFSGNPVSYIKEFIEMIEYTIELFSFVPDCDLLINRKDFPYIRKDGKYAYTHLINENIENGPEKWYPIACQSKTSENLDIPIPSADEWNSIKTSSEEIVEWKDKKNVALFRGSSTGCCMNLNNDRIRLAQEAYDNVYDNLDVKLTKITNRIKICDYKIQLVENKYDHLLGNFMTISEQLNYKYIFNIQGNAQAYRYSTEFSKGSVILNIQSKYYMWFEKLLVNKKNYILINNDFSNLKSELKFLNKNDKKANTIAKNGNEFFKTWINKEKIATYLYYYMNYSNKLIFK